MTASTVEKTAPEVAINDIGSEEDLLAAIDATIKHFNDGDIVEGRIVKVDRDEVLLDIAAVMTVARGAQVFVYDAPFTGRGTSFQAIFNAMMFVVFLVFGLLLGRLVNDTIIVENKVIEVVLPLHKAQLRSYLKLANRRLGLLINFNESLMKNGIFRIANGI